MRLLHPYIIEILARDFSGSRYHISHVWSEIFKWYGSGKKKHPKMYILNDIDLGQYLRFVYRKGILVGCNLDINKVNSLPIGVRKGFFSSNDNDIKFYLDWFNDKNLFSDAVSLYFKGVNIFPQLYGNLWRQYVPVESLEEIKRQVDNTLKKRKKIKK